MNRTIATVLAVMSYGLAVTTASAQMNSANQREIVSFTEHFTSFDGTKGSLDGKVFLAGQYNDTGTRHEDFTVIGQNQDGSEVFITITGKITASQGTMSLIATGTIHFTSGKIAYVEGPETITGGTGAYANARGKGSFVCTQDSAGNPDQIVGTFNIGGPPATHFANISTRGFVEFGERAEIGGFIVRGDQGLTPVIVRALGPSLAGQGVAAPLPDPTLDLRDKDGARVAYNDNWKDDAAGSAAISGAGLAPSNDREAAIFAMLPSGEYTAIVSDKNGNYGSALVEMYNLSD